MSVTRSHHTDPELLAPAGNWECARAAVANGADAIFFGLPTFNARLRADNFTEEDLPELMDFLHAHGVRGFVTFNTLIFTGELEAARERLLRISDAGVDAILVQDLGLARMARQIVPELEIHASTQMTITSPEALRFIHNTIGLDRAVIARENSLSEIHLFKANEADAVPLETFVHGALCVAYSGQCLTSESLGQRSANRGECAQACRMPYDLIVDNKEKDMGDRKYLLSPQDLAGVDQIPDLLREGIVSFKIEGRLKSPEYVAAVTRVYRKALDDAEITDTDRYQLEMTFSRGLHSGWLNGIDNQKLVHARFGKKRGAFIGRISSVGSDHVAINAQAPLAPGDGLVFDTGGDTDREQGGRLYEIKENRLYFQHGKIDFSQIKKGDRIWKTHDPKLEAEIRKTFTADKLEATRTPLRWKVSGSIGTPLVLEDLNSGFLVESSLELSHAENRPLTEEVLRQKLGKLGATSYELSHLEVDLSGDLILPLSELNHLRRSLVEKLDQAPTAEKKKRLTNPLPLSDLLPVSPSLPPSVSPSSNLRLLCRTEEQLDAAIESGITHLYLDLEDVRRYREVVGHVRKNAPEAKLFLATPRIQKPGETGLFKIVERAQPDGILVRNLGGIDYFQGHPDLKMIGDFSLNVANPLTASFLMEQGFKNLTISYDLNISQTLDLLRAAPPEWFELTLHQHMPMFHMEHCVFCTFLSEGTNVTNCGRPCDKHEVKLRDRVGQHHILTADVGCRNTLFNGRAQTGARFLTPLRDTGLSTFRIELLKETKEKAFATIQGYQSLLAGDQDGDNFLRTLRAESRLGVTEGTLVDVQ